MLSPRLRQSRWLKALVMFAAVGGFIWRYETTIPDSRFLSLPSGFSVDTTSPPGPGVRQSFSATAYCKGQVTSSGVAPKTGVVAADPTLLPVGSIVDVSMDDDRYDGIYTVLDTGPEIKGREVDVYMWSCNEALEFGRKPARVTVLRLGWDPRATTPSFIARLFGRTAPRRAASRPPAPAAAASPDEGAQAATAAGDAAPDAEPAAGVPAPPPSIIGLPDEMTVGSR